MSIATATVEVPVKKAPPASRHDVDTPVLLATINAVGGQPELAKFQFRAKNQWIKGTHSRTTMSDFSGVGGEHRHVAETTADGDHPAALVGADQAPTPVEWVLHALASCLTAGIANIAAARGVTLKRVESTIPAVQCPGHPFLFSGVRYAACRLVDTAASSAAQQGHHPRADFIQDGCARKQGSVARANRGRNTVR